MIPKSMPRTRCGVGTGFQTRSCSNKKGRGTVMQSPREILGDIWTSASGDPAALDAVTLTGDEPQLPSSFRVAAAAQTSVAAAGLAAAAIWKLRSGQSQDVAVDMRHA